MSEYNQARREGVIKSGFDFSSLAEVTHLFGKTAKRLPYQISFRIPGRENAICLLLSENGGRGWKNVPHHGAACDDRGWHEIIQVDEFNEQGEVSAKRVEDELSRPLDRFVFWRMERKGAKWYKFCGHFRLDAEATKASRAAGENKCIYRKIADEMSCLRAAA